MKNWAGLIGVLSPFLILLLASWTPLKGKKLWRASLLVNLVSWFCFMLLFASFYTGKNFGQGQVDSPFILGTYNWTGQLFFRWDFLGASLSLAACTVVVCFHFLSREIIENSRSTMAALSAYFGCLLGALGAGQLFLFAVFFAGSLVPRFVFTGVDVKRDGIDSVKETAFLAILSLFCLITVVLAFYSPFRSSLSEWFQLSGNKHVVLPGAIGISLLLFASAIASGIFPFHGSLRKAFESESVERLVPLALQPLFGFTILFRFSVDLFPAEFKAFSPAFLGLFSVGLALGAVGFSGSRLARERIFWLQQANIFLVVLGFFTLSSMGWHGSSILMLFQCLAIPFLLIVLSCHERRGNLPFSRITELPAIALSTAGAVLCALFLPISIGFYGVLLVVWSLGSFNGWSLPFVLLAIPVIALAGMKSMFFDLGEKADGGPGGEGFRDLDPGEIFSILPIAGALLLLGIVPKILMSPIGVSSAALLSGMGLGH